MDVDQYSIKAQLDESTRLLSLIGQVKGVEKETANVVSSSNLSSSSSSNTLQEKIKVGTTKENRNTFNLEYEIYLGNDLKDGQVKVEAINNAINISVSKRNWDKYGDYSIEFNRQIKLPLNLNVQRIEHGIDYRTASLHIKIPIQ